MRRSDKKPGCYAHAIAAAEQQAHCGVAGVAVAKREGDARSCTPPSLLVLWNGIKMGIALLERVLWHERCSVIGARVLLQHHGNVEGACGLLANLNVGVEERHVAEPLAERDALMNDADHGARGGWRMRVLCARAVYQCVAVVVQRLAVPPHPLIVFGRRT
jgi:hypothetical protein